MDSGNRTGRDGAGVRIGLSTIGFDKSSIAYSAAYTFAYSFLLLLVFIGCFLLSYDILGWEGGGLVYLIRVCIEQFPASRFVPSFLLLYNVHV